MEAQGPHGRSPGWYSDPQGQGRRYWDGTKWTDGYSQGAQPQEQSPQQSKKQPTSLQVVVGVVLGVATLVVGWVAVQGVTSGSDESFEQELYRKQNRNAITNEQARGVKTGMTRREVERRFGPPKPGETGRNQGFGNDTCIYYNLRGSRSFDQWQFCFEGAGRGAKLTLKNRFS